MNKFQKRIDELRSQSSNIDDTIRRFKEILKEEDDDVYGLTRLIINDEIKKLKIKNEKIKDEIILVQKWFE